MPSLSGICLSTVAPLSPADSIVIVPDWMIRSHTFWL